MQITVRYLGRDRSKPPFRSSELEIRIGRLLDDAAPDIELSPDTSVSRLHALIYYRQSGWWVEDARSRNGTFLNGQLIAAPSPLTSGDELTMGSTKLRVEFETNDTPTDPGLLDSQVAVSEPQPTPAISEDWRLEIYARIARLGAEIEGRVLLDALLTEIGSAFPQSERRAIVLVEQPELVAQAFFPRSSAHVSFTLARRAIAQRQAFRWLRTLRASSVPSLGDTTAALYAPLLCNGQIIGVVCVDTASPETTFNESDVQLLSVIANTIGPSIQASRQPGARLPNVFVSYAPEDRPKVDQLAGELRRRAIKVWFDERLQFGDDRRQIIHTAIQASDAVLLLVSSANLAEPMWSELDIALKANRHIIPLLDQPGPLPNPIRHLTPVNLADEENLNQLAQQIHILPRNERKQEVSAMRILFLAASPTDWEQLRVDKESAEIGRRLRAAELRECFQLEKEFAVRADELTQKMMIHKPHIVHFAGHGAGAGILLENQEGKAQLVETEVLAKIFRVLKDNVRCVVLNGCWTAEQAEGIAQHIDCVIGMTKPISDTAATSFAAGFYQALGFGRNVQDAFELGCLEIDLAKLAESETPQLKTRPGVNATEITLSCT